VNDASKERTAPGIWAYFSLSFSENVSHIYALFQLCYTYCAELHTKKRKMISATYVIFGQAMLQQIGASTSQLKEMGHIARVDKSKFIIHALYTEKHCTKANIDQ